MTPTAGAYSARKARAQSDLQTGTRRTAFEPGAHRLSQEGQQTYRYNANGQPERVGSREYVWDALGRLVEVREEAQPLARYQYDHRGLRNAKRVGEQTTHTLYDESRQPLAELDGQGRITRQYIYLADMALAVIDSAHPLAPQTPGVAQVLSDLGQVLQSWLGTNEGLVWLHTNHLGAPEAATDAAGQLVWQASYAPFGAASVQSAGGFTLNLRLPGQYFDGETALHYNRARYYDPAQGQYLSPDPLGTPDGPNGYAYVRFNPLKYVDPDGLVLFAFDGTGNTNDAAWLAQNNSSPSNVWNFRQAYADGNRRYVSGVGTVHQDSQYGNIENPWYKGGSTGDMGLNLTGVARIDRMIQYFNDEAELATDDSTAMAVDIIGFSRGAAEARDFANQIVANTLNGWYSYTLPGNDGKVQAKCQKVDFRFMGLWDTVLSTNNGRAYNLTIPNEFAYVAQAVALNEYRGDTVHPYGSLGAFPLESIMAGMYSPVPTPGQTRIEMGFIGAHADIGGGFAQNESQLARVALTWMVQQAKAAKVGMNDPRYDIPADPVIHDKSDSIRTGVPIANAEDRTVRYQNGSSTTQRDMTLSAGMSYLDTQLPEMINYLPANDPARFQSAQEGQNFVTGSVNMKLYLQWLRDHGYDLGNLQVQ